MLRIAFKVGGALFPDDGADADTLFRNAEAALKKAKAIGDRYLFYTQKMTEMVAVKLTSCAKPSTRKNSCSTRSRLNCR